MRTFVLTLAAFAGLALTAGTADAGHRYYGGPRGFYGRPYYGNYYGGGVYRPYYGGAYGRPYYGGYARPYYGYRPGFNITIGSGGFVPLGGFGPGFYGPGFYRW